MSSVTFLITLDPLGKFCFGDGLQGEYGNRKNYFLRSNPFPQQTGLLGFIRHQLLLQNELLTEGERGISPDNIAKANDLIGSNGFNGVSESYGIIQQISPLFICFEGKHYSWRNREKGRVYNEATNTIEIKDVEFNKVENNIPKLMNYEVKHGFSEYFQNVDGYQLKFDDVFIRQEQTGIRMENKKVDDDAFYRQVSYKFKNRFLFSLYVTFDMDLFLNIFPDKINPLGTSFSYMGKEKSPMKITVKKEDYDLNKIVASQSQNNEKYLCLSDVLITNTEVFNTSFIAGEDGNFNYFRTNNSLANHNRLSREGNDSDPNMNTFNTRVLKKGSIIYADSKLINDLEKKTSYYNIGFNHFVSIQ